MPITETLVEETLAFELHKVDLIMSQLRRLMQCCKDFYNSIVSRCLSIVLPNSLTRAFHSTLSNVTCTFNASDFQRKRLIVIDAIGKGI